MAYFNRVSLIGNLTRDPQLKQLPNDNVVADFGLAMNRRYRTATGEDREEVTFVDCAAFGKQAEVIGQYCKKGKQIFVDGRLKYDSWEDKTGAKRSKVSVVVDNFQFLGTREESERAVKSDSDRTLYDEDDAKTQDRPERPARATAGSTPTRGGPKRKAFDDKAKFKDADIPF